MSNRSDSSMTESTDSRGYTASRNSDQFLWKLGFAAVLAFMVGGLIGGATRMNATVENSWTVLWANGTAFGLLFLALVTGAVGYSIGQFAKKRM